MSKNMHPSERVDFMTGRAQATHLKTEVLSAQSRLQKAKYHPPAVTSLPATAPSSVQHDSSPRSSFSILSAPNTLGRGFGEVLRINLGEDGNPLPLGDPRLDQGYTDYQNYQNLKSTLFEWETIYASTAGPRERAFYSSLRSVLMEALRSQPAEVRREKIDAAAVWFAKNRPRARPLTSVGAVPAKHKPSPGFQRVNQLANFGVKSAFFNAYSRDLASPLVEQRTFEVPPSSSASAGEASVGGTPRAGAGGRFSPGKSTRSLWREGEPPRRPQTRALGVDGRPSAAAEWGSRAPSRAGLAASPAAEGRPDVRRSASANPAPRAASSSVLAPLPHNSPGQWQRPSSSASNASRPPSGLTRRQDPWRKPHPEPGSDEEDDVFSDGSMERLHERADQDAQKMDHLRAKWRASETQTHHWLQDVQESLMKWSFQRARTEEEIIRRQEASRYTMPYPPIVSNPNEPQFPDDEASAPVADWRDPCKQLAPVDDNQYWNFTWTEVDSYT